MSNLTPTHPYARRWHALLAENSALQEENLDLLSSLAPLFTAQQIAQLKSSTARREKISRKIVDLVDE